MAKYRNISVKFWSDDFVAEELTPEKRYFFLYLLTNEHTAQCGIYEITKRQMAFETGYNAETIEKLLQYFEVHGKIKWSKETNEIAIKNFIRYNPQGSPKVKSYVTKELLAVKNQALVDFIYKEEKQETAKSGQLYPIDPLSQEEREEELKEERELEKESISPASRVMAIFNSVNKKYEPKATGLKETKSRTSSIKNRMKDFNKAFPGRDFFKACEVVFEYKAIEWFETDMWKYFEIDTMMRESNFIKYCEQAAKNKGAPPKKSDPKQVSPKISSPFEKRDIHA